MNASSSEGNIPDGKTPVEAGTPGVKVPVSSSPGDFLSDVASTLLATDGNPAKVRMHRVEFRQYKVDRLLEDSSEQTHVISKKLGWNLGFL